MKWVGDILACFLIGTILVFGVIGVVSVIPSRSLQAVRMNENTVQIMYTPSKPVYVTCYSNTELLECVNAPDYGRIIYITTHMATEYTVKTYYQDGSIEENRITVQVP